MTPEKREALEQRANILIEWLHKTDFALYEHEGSLGNLAKAVDIIVWALQNTLTISEWQQFEVEFLVAKKTLTTVMPTEQEKRDCLQESLTMIESTLHSYLEYINRA